MKFILAVAWFVTAVVSAAETETPLRGTDFKDPENMPDTCDYDYGMLLKHYLEHTKQVTFSVPCALDDKECLGKWPGMLQWIQEKRIQRFDPERVKLISMPETDKPLIHIAGQFYVFCQSWRYENGKKAGMGEEIKFKLRDQKLERKEPLEEIAGWTAAEIDNWLRIEDLWPAGVTVHDDL